MKALINISYLLFGDGMSIFPRQILCSLIIPMLMFPFSCKSRSESEVSATTSVPTAQQLGSQRSVLTSRILYIFSDKVYPGWKFKVESAQKFLVDANIADIINSGDNDSFYMIPPVTDKLNIAFHVKLDKVAMAQGIIKNYIRVLSSDLRTIKTSRSIVIEPASGNARKQRTFLEETFINLQANVSGNKTGFNNKSISDDILSFLEPTAYGADSQSAALGRALRAGMYAGLAIGLASMAVWGFKAFTSIPRPVLIALGIGLGLALIFASVEYIIYGKEPPASKGIEPNGNISYTSY